MNERQEQSTERVFDYERREDGTHAFYFRPRKLDLVPDETRAHFRAAGKEFLLALRSLVDAAIQREEEAERETEGPRKIEVT